MSLILGNVFAFHIENSALSIGDNEGKHILYVVASQEDYTNISSSYVAESTSDIVDLITVDDLGYYTPIDYQAVAVPYEHSNTINLEYLFQHGVTIYIYGGLTMTEYSQAINAPLELERVVSDIGDTEVLDRKTVTLQDLGIEYAVIGWSNRDVTDKGLLCSFDDANIEQYYYYNAITRNYAQSQTQIQTQRSIELIDQQTDYEIYYNNNQSTTYMDWYLSKDVDELDPDRDYYAITTHVWATTDAPGSEISSVGVKNALILDGDDLYDTAPSSSSSLDGGSISVDLISGSVSATLNLSSDPGVIRTQDYTNDNVEWQFHPRSFRPLPIDGEVFKTITVWSTDSTNDPLIDVSYRSATQRANITPTYQSWMTIRVNVE